MSDQHAPRPMHVLRDLMRRVPTLSADVETFVVGKRRGDLHWPDWIMMPMAAWDAIAAKYATDRLQRVTLTQLLAAVGAWRYSQGIYRLDPDLQRALIDTPLTRELPTDVLLRLPEWSIYVETPGLQYGTVAVAGSWVHLERDTHTGVTELRLLLDTDRLLIGLPIPLDQSSLHDVADRLTERLSAYTSPPLPVDEEDRVALAAVMSAIVSIVLYICSDTPDIDDLRSPGSSPSRPMIVKVRRGYRLFAPDRARVWTVGANIGETIRADRDGGSIDGVRTVRPHIRRAHWHGYWTGPRDGERRFVYHWLPPMVVAAGEAEGETSR